MSINLMLQTCEPATLTDAVLQYWQWRNAVIVASDRRRRERQPRKPRLKTFLDRAKKAGANSVTTPDGVTYRFGDPSANSQTNPWDKVLSDAANKKRPA